MELSADQQALLAGAVDGLASAVEAVEIAAPVVDLLRGICELYQAHRDAPEHAKSLLRTVQLCAHSLIGAQSLFDDNPHSRALLSELEDLLAQCKKAAKKCLERKRVKAWLRHKKDVEKMARLSNEIDELMMRCQFPMEASQPRGRRPSFARRRASPEGGGTASEGGWSCRHAGSRRAPAVEVILRRADCSVAAL